MPFYKEVDMIFKKHKNIWRLISILVLAFTVLNGCAYNTYVSTFSESGGDESTAEFTQTDTSGSTEAEAPDADPAEEDEPEDEPASAPTVGPTETPTPEDTPTVGPTATPTPTEAPAPAEAEPEEDTIDENGEYTSKDDVALYIHTYNKLPANFITKKDAQALGWTGGSLEPYAPGKSIGGDRFGNYEGILPEGKYKECDIDTKGKKSRGAKRIVFDDKGNIYYTDDHYESFTQLY